MVTLAITVRLSDFLESKIHQYFYYCTDNAKAIGYLTLRLFSAFSNLFSLWTIIWVWQIRNRNPCPRWPPLARCTTYKQWELGFSLQLCLWADASVQGVKWTNIWGSPRSRAQQGTGSLGKQEKTPHLLSTYWRRRERRRKMLEVKKV